MLDMIVPSRFGLFRREMDQLFSDFLGNGWNWDREAPASFPALNVWEDGQNVYAEAEMPGVKIEQVEISVTDDQLTLQGRSATEVHEDIEKIQRALRERAGTLKSGGRGIRARVSPRR